MPSLKNDPQVQQLMAAAEERGAKNERKRITRIVADAKNDAGSIEDRDQRRAAKDALSGVATAIKA